MGITKKTIAKITPVGKKKLFEKGIHNLITKFSLGDSDAFYSATDSLKENILDISGSETSTFNNVEIKNPLFKDEYNVFKIFSETEKYLIEEKEENEVLLDFTTKGIYINKSVNEPNLNILSSIGAPINDDEINLFNSPIFNMNSYRSFLSDEYIVYPFDYKGEVLTGEDLKIKIGETELYSSLPKGTQNPNSTIFDDSNLALRINKNMVCLFSDEINPPLEGGSWSDGNGIKNPYSNGKKLFNLFKENNTFYGDRIVGYVLLDKGVIVIFNDELIKKFKEKENTVQLTTTSLTNFLGYEVVCNINRNEFSLSTNKTHNNNYALRVSEVGLYDDDNDLIAIAKLDKHIILDKLNPIAISLSISI